ncbi:GNAT family protein [Streptosporangium sp. NPDC048047]|uniref:GNAT family N-acetyltransferase n=1 Tax=unclassified Streptosporangium TaxID=2632669 RepID=UPI003412B4BB
MRNLITARLVLVPWEHRFLDDLVRLSADERVMRFVGSGPWDGRYAGERHESALGQWATHGFGMRAVTSADDGRFLGLVSLGESRATGFETPVFEIGWWVDPAEWGHGIATEAAASVRDEAFSRVGARSIVACFHRDNTASERIMAKLGMSPHGDVIDRYGEPARMYALTRAEWERLGSPKPLSP